MTVPASIESGLYVGMVYLGYNDYYPRSDLWEGALFSRHGMQMMALRLKRAWSIYRDPDYIFREWDAVQLMSIKDLYWDWTPPREREITDMTDGDLWAA